MKKKTEEHAPAERLKTAAEIRELTIKNMEIVKYNKVEAKIKFINGRIDSLAKDGCAIEEFFIADAVSSLEEAKTVVKPFLRSGYKAYWDENHKEIRICLEQSRFYKKFALIRRRFPRQELLMDGWDVILGHKFFLVQ